MTETPEGPVRPPDVEPLQSTESLLETAEHLAVMMGQQAKLAMDQLRLQNFDDLPKAGAAIRDLIAVCKLVLEQRAQIARQRKEQAGVVYDFALDLARARAEIDGRLARIRAAGGHGPVAE